MVGGLDFSSHWAAKDTGNVSGHEDRVFYRECCEKPGPCTHP